MNQIANTPEPPYYAVIFTSVRSATDEGYADTAAKMVALASGQPGFLGVESVREQGGPGITVSYWKDKKSILDWKNHTAHRQAQRFGKEKWYRSYKIRVAKVDTDYGH
ncbi:MAG: antibiotic biosynthesis monooxygenase, partial [Deltaproteobacteria bacterium]|nr:antibiotic biosynthesis monooxygenase [Deltaproteobacteria bacterium]